MTLIEHLYKYKIKTMFLQAVFVVFFKGLRKKNYLILSLYFSKSGVEI